MRIRAIELVQTAQHDLPIPADLIQFLDQSQEQLCRPLGEASISILTALICSLPPPEPRMRLEQVLQTCASWLSHLYYAPLPLEFGWLMNMTDNAVLMDPTILLGMPELLTHVWSNILQQSMVIVRTSPREHGEVLINPLMHSAGRFIAQLPNGLYAGVLPRHAV